MESVADVDPSWLRAGSDVVVWVDIEDPDDGDRALLSETFRFHELTIEQALAEVHHPKIELWDDVLYLILHGIATGEGEPGFVTDDVDRVTFPPELLRADVSVAIGVTTYRVEGEPWDRYLILLLAGSSDPRLMIVQR